MNSTDYVHRVGRTHTHTLTHTHSHTHSQHTHTHTHTHAPLIPSVDLVLNYDIPMNSKDYVHRVGRTARAGRSGRAISVVTQYDVELFQKIEHLINKKLDEVPTEEDAVLLLLERVSEAQRIATMQVRDPPHPKTVLSFTSRFSAGANQGCWEAVCGTGQGLFQCRFGQAI